jgi:hypothetical protein
VYVPRQSDRLLGPDRLQSNSICCDSKVITTHLAHELEINYGISCSDLYYRQQPHCHLKMAEIKRPVGLLFDIGGVCVSQPLDSEVEDI